MSRSGFASRRLKKKLGKTPKQRFSSKGRIILFSSIAAVIVGLFAAYIIYSVNAWSGAVAAAKDTRQEVKGAIESKFGSKVTPNNREIDLAALADTYRPSMISQGCELPFVIQWQQVLWFAEAITAQCREQYKDTREVLTRLDALADFTVQSNAIAKKFADAAAAATNKKTTLADAKKAWEVFITSTETQSVHESVVETRTKSIEAATGIIEAYDVVFEAEKLQDRAKYDAAIVALGKSYDATSTITEAARAAYASLLSEFLESFTLLSEGDLG